MNSESDSTGGMESESTLDIIGHRVSFHVIKISFKNSSTFPPNRALSSPSPSHLTVRGSPLVLKTGAYSSGAHAQGRCSASVGLFQPSIYLPMVETRTLRIDSLCGATGSHVWQKRDVRFRPVAFLWLTRGFENSIFLLEKNRRQEESRT